MSGSLIHPRVDLDSVIHPPIRLSVIAMLSNHTDFEFGKLCDAVGISAAVLSKHMSSLEAAGYIRVRKGYVGRRPRTWLSITAQGLDAFERHAAALLAISHGTPRDSRDLPSENRGEFAQSPE